MCAVQCGADPYLQLLMDVIHGFAKFEPPEERVRSWIKQCNFTHRNLQHEAEDLEDDIRSRQESYSGSSSTHCSSNGEEREKHEKTRIVHLSSKQRGSAISYRDCLSNSSYGRPYSIEESVEIINYIVKNNKFAFIKGDILWREMETNEVCDRSWQSMKSQFLSKIYPSINSYSMQPQDRQKFHNHMEPLKPRKYLHLEPGERGWRKNVRYYTESEDLVILKYILQKHRYLYVLGNSLWQTMEDKKVLPGRSWHSMRTRFLKTIRHSLKQYDIPESSIKKLRMGKDMDTKEKLNLSPLHCPRSEQRFICEKKKKQNIRKFAVGASIKLALDMKKLKNVQQTSEKNEKKVHFLSTLDCGTRSNEINMDIQNNSLQQNLDNNNDISRKRIQTCVGNNSPLSNSDDTSNICGKNIQTHTQENSFKNQIFTFDSYENLTQSCIDKNSAIGNLNCAIDNSGKIVQTCDKQKNSPIINFSFTYDSPEHGTQECVEDNSLIVTSNNADSVEKLGTHFEESSPMMNLVGTLDSSENVKQICLQNNSSIGNTNCFSDSSGEMFDEDNSPVRNLKVTSSRNGTQKSVECCSAVVEVSKIVGEERTSTINLVSTVDSSKNVNLICLQNNFSVGNTNCVCDNPERNLQIFDEENSSIRNLKITCDSSRNGTQNNVQCNSPVVEVLKIVDDASRIKTQQCIENISSERNLKNAGDNFNNVVQVCFKNNLSVQDSKHSDYNCINKIQDCVEKDYQKDSEMSENINVAFVSELISEETNITPSSSMNSVIRTGMVNKNGDDMERVSVEREGKNVSNYVENEDMICKEKLDDQGKKLL